MAKATTTWRVADLVSAMEQIAPTRLAEDWDNVGLIVGDPAWPLGRALLTIDFTSAVLTEAQRGRFDAVVSYHPPVYRPVKRMTPDPTDQAGIAAAALASRIAVYSPHTAMDCAPGGPNDVLAEVAGLRDIAPFGTSPTTKPQCKVVVFVPAEAVDKVSEAVFAAGAGRIGAYEKCSYRLAGHGTFFGSDAANPAVGRKGRLEKIDEIRVEAVLPTSRVRAVAAAIRKTHPYEEPAFDVYPLAEVPARESGMGRVGGLAKGTTLRSLARVLAKKLSVANVSMIGSPNAKLLRGIVCVGAAGSIPFEQGEPACGKGDVVITGEIRHHDALRYQRCGATAIALGHWASERRTLPVLASRLRDMLPKIAAVVSRSDRDPFLPV